MSCSGAGRRSGQQPEQSPEQYPGVNGLVHYSEGLLVGYRWYDAKNIEPLFPFGHGLSYTTFGYKDLKVSRPTLDGRVSVKFTVTNTGDVEVLVKPPTTAPRRNPKKRSRLVTEHQRRKGDPVLGGSTRAPIMTAYRQQALACAAALVQGPRRVRDLRPEIPDAPKILLHNVYGWFDRAERGVYALTEAGHAALKRWPQISDVFDSAQ